MTAVGKILVILNLLFAFVVGTFAVLAYIARTNWHDQHERVKNSYTVVKSTAEVQKRENDKFNQERDSLVKTMREEGVMADKVDPSKAPDLIRDKLRKQKEEIEELKKTLKREQDQAVKIENELTRYKATSTVSQADVARRQENEEKLREVLAKETTRNSQLVAQVAGMRDRYVAAEIETKSLKGINARLEEQMQEMRKENARLAASGGGRAPVASASGRNPPPEQVEGLIQRVDGDLVTLSIGSDAGLHKGHTMFVFGLGGNVGYRGEIKLVEVTPKVAVGQVKGKLASRIRVGDTAASDILPRR